MPSPHQFDLVKTELELVQSVIDKYDSFSIKIKTWAVTLWLASVGWATARGGPTLLYVSLFMIIALWIIDGVNKTIRNNYKLRRRQFVVSRFIPPYFGNNRPRITAR